MRNFAKQGIDCLKLLSQSLAAHDFARQVAKTQTHTTKMDDLTAFCIP
jgi:hypothetical protein